ncbi:LOG family protein [Cyanobacterium aponinum FACHB-4101]|uniref:LOG family protein n=1 Tax=Cyanobacterium aponinum TaxID=379064 RepID=UPI00168131F2|nr:LOG family protein [Cyanobacterium aponinum]MBD2392724.1 LOG family protein [Cyanobacterium aponinum FACHB-4101]
MSLVNSPSLATIKNLVKNLPNTKKSKWLKKSFKTLIRIVEKKELDRLEWKILTGTLKDLERGFQTFSDYRNRRKITVFGSARAPVDSPEYLIARDFAHAISQLGFMVLTGAGGGIMEAGNEGASSNNSFGLNIKLPFEQTANKFIFNDPKLINFKYFFTRKLFFLKESDAIALFPGGFGTQDEAFETITLCQTGRQPLIPLVLIDKPGGKYWHNWHNYLVENLLARGYIQEDDIKMYQITDDVESACEIITNFYRVYHSSRYIEDLFVIRLNYDLTDAQLQELNDSFADVLSGGKIERRRPTKSEQDSLNLPQIAFHLQAKKFSRLYQMIQLINTFSCEESPYCLPQYR